MFVHRPAAVVPIYLQQDPANPQKHLRNMPETLLLRNLQLSGRHLVLPRQRMREGHIAEKLKKIKLGIMLQK